MRIKRFSENLSSVSPVTDNILSCVRSVEKYLCGDGPGKKVKKLEDIYSY